MFEEFVVQIDEGEEFTTKLCDLQWKPDERLVLVVVGSTPRQRWRRRRLNRSGFVSPDRAVDFVVTVVVVVEVVVGLDGLPMPGRTFRHHNTPFVKFSTFASQIVTLKFRQKQLKSLIVITDNVINGLKGILLTNDNKI